MKLGIMQPYFFPYLGYFSLIKQTDEFILFDTPQFMRHGWIERNRVLKPQEGWQYVSVPLKKRELTTPICEVKIHQDEDWKGRIVRQLEHYKKRSPFYQETLSVIHEALNISTDSIAELNHHALGQVCAYLGIPYRARLFSKMGLQVAEAQAPDEWALNICKALGYATEYWNPIGGTEFFDRKKYADAGIRLCFQSVTLSPYSQRRGEGNFEPGLSIIDVMMFNSPLEIAKMLDCYELV